MWKRNPLSMRIFNVCDSTLYHLYLFLLIFVHFTFVHVHVHVPVPVPVPVSVSVSVPVNAPANAYVSLYFCFEYFNFHSTCSQPFNHSNGRKRLLLHPTAQSIIHYHFYTLRHATQYMQARYYRK